MLLASEKKGFTIIEMAIATVIISLLVAAIIASSDVLDAANRNSIIKEINQYKAAIINFRIKYEQLPGDMDNANDYWSSATNGDGDGYTRRPTTEGAYAWNHLSSAEFLQKKYDGTYSAGSYDSTIPESSINNSYYILETAGIGNCGNWKIADNSIYGITGTFIGLGAHNDDFEAAQAADGTLSAKDAKAIDLKIDDGNASAGDTVFIKGVYLDSVPDTVYSDGCVEGADEAYASATYGSIDFDLDNDYKGCRLIHFLKGLD